MHEAGHLDYEETIHWLSELSGQRIAVELVDPETAILARFTGWFVSGIEAGSDGVWFSVRDGSDPPSSMIFAVWRSSFETAVVNHVGIQIKMRHVVLGVTTALSEYPKPRDPLEGMVIARERSLPSDMSNGVDVSGMELPEITSDENVQLALTFKHEEETPEGEAIGPAWVWREDDPDQGTVAELGWMALSQARAVAEERGYSFYED